MTIRDDATFALARVDALHTALTHLVLEGGDLRQITAEAADVLGVGVLLTSTDGRERASALSDEARTLLADARLVDVTGRIRVERVTDGGLSLGLGEVRALRVAAGGIHLLKPSQGELAALVGRPLDSLAEQEAAACDLVAGGVGIVALTMGHHGALLAHAGGTLLLRPPAVEARSTTGAGDSFLAAMVLALAEGRPPEAAFRRGVAAGTAAVLLGAPLP